MVEKREMGSKKNDLSYYGKLFKMGLEKFSRWTEQYTPLIILQGRLLVMKFPYSDLKSLPADIPAHLVNSALLIPKQMNTLLTQLLQVKEF